MKHDRRDFAAYAKTMTQAQLRQLGFRRDKKILRQSCDPLVSDAQGKEALNQNIPGKHQRQVLPESMDSGHIAELFRMAILKKSAVIASCPRVWHCSGKMSCVAWFSTNLTDTAVAGRYTLFFQCFRRLFP